MSVISIISVLPFMPLLAGFEGILMSSSHSPQTGPGRHVH